MKRSARSHAMPRLHSKYANHHLHQGSMPSCKPISCSSTSSRAVAEPMAFLEECCCLGGRCVLKQGLHLTCSRPAKHRTSIPDPAWPGRQISRRRDEGATDRGTIRQLPTEPDSCQACALTSPRPSLTNVSTCASAWSDPSIIGEHSQSSSSQYLATSTASGYVHHGKHRHSIR